MVGEDLCALGESFAEVLNDGRRHRRGRRCSAGRPATPCPSVGSGARSRRWPTGSSWSIRRRMRTPRPGTPTGTRRRIPGRVQGLLTTNPDIAGWAYEYSDGMYTGLQAYEELGIPVENLTVALRTDEQTLFCDWVERERADVQHLVLGRWQLPVTGRRHRGDDVAQGRRDPGRDRRAARDAAGHGGGLQPESGQPVRVGYLAGAGPGAGADVCRLMTRGDPEGASTHGGLVLELSGVSRQFGAVRALTDVSFDCRAGEVHALVGENGSGKSTLLGIASGFVDPDLGTVQIGGKPLRRDSPALARKLGLAMAYQDTSLILPEPVKNNLYLAAPAGPAAAVLAEEEVGEEAAGRVRSRPRALPGRPGGVPHPGRPSALRGGQGPRHRPEGAAARRAHHGPGTGRGGGAPSDRRRLQASRCRCGLREPSAPRGPRDRRPHHRPSRRSEPGHLRCEGHDRGGARRADRRPPLRGGLPAARSRVRASLARCWWSTASRASRSGRSASPWRAARSWGSPGPKATASPSSSTAWPAASRRRRVGSSATARSCP